MLDDATVVRLRYAALGRGIEVEQLIVHLLERASRDIDAVLRDEGEIPGAFGASSE